MYLPPLLLPRPHSPVQVTGDKEKRTVIHRAIREHFPDLESKTEEGDDPDEKVISVQLAEKKPSRHGE